MMWWRAAIAETIREQIGNRQGERTDLKDEDEEVVEDFARAEEGSVPRFLYGIVRDRAMQLHYTNAAAWRVVQFLRPPQPRGYRDYWRRPHG